MRATLILFASAIIVAVLSVSGEFTSGYSAERTFLVSVVPEDASLIKLTPNSPYAYLDGKGKLRIEISEDNPNFPGFGKGVAPDTKHAFDCVFRVKNNLWTNRTIIFKINSSGESLLLYSNKSISNNAPQSAVNSLTFKLGWKEEACVGIVINSTGEKVGAVIEVRI